MLTTCNRELVDGCFRQHTKRNLLPAPEDEPEALVEGVPAVRLGQPQAVLALPLPSLARSRLSPASAVIRCGSTTQVPSTKTACRRICLCGSH